MCCVADVILSTFSGLKFKLYIYESRNSYHVLYFPLHFRYKITNSSYYYIIIKTVTIWKFRIYRVFDNINISALKKVITVILSCNFNLKTIEKRHALTPIIVDINNIWMIYSNTQCESLHSLIYVQLINIIFIFKLSTFPDNLLFLHVYIILYIILLQNYLNTNINICLKMYLYANANT